MTPHQAIACLVEGQDLSRADSAALMGAVMRGELTDAQLGGLLIALRMKGETVEEITGFAETMRGFAARIETRRKPLVDTCGTGGDASGTFNISTAAAFVVAGGDVAVAKHGNRSASSRCGSADVLEALGVSIDIPPQRVGRCIDEIGIGFLYARSLHTAMRFVAKPRSELGVRTVFNLLGPLTNPAGASAQVIGVYDRHRVEDMAGVLKQLGTTHSFVVAGEDGLDEITLGGRTFVAEATEAGVETYTLSPSDLGLPEHPAASIRGGAPDANAQILRGVLSGEKTPHRDYVLANAAAAFRAADRAENWKDAVALAEHSIDSGAAAGKLDALAAFTQELP